MIGQLILLVVILGLIGALVGIVLLAAVYLVPAAIVIAAAFWLARHPYFRIRRRYDDVRAQVSTVVIPNNAALREDVFDRYIERLEEQDLLPPSRAMAAALDGVIEDLIDEEALGQRVLMPEPPRFQWRLRPSYWDLAGRLDELETASRHRHVADEFAGAVTAMLVTFTAALPRSATRSWQEYKHGEETSEGHLSVPAYDAIHGVGTVIGDVAAYFDDRDAEELGLFERLRNGFANNMAIQSARQLTKTQLDAGVIVPPHAYPGTPAEIVNGYLAGTPWRAPFAVPVPFDVARQRFQHQWVVAPTGSGKTQLLKAQIVADLPKVARGEASIVVIDSQGSKPGTLVGDLIRLKLFAPGQPLDGRLVFLDPDPAYPLALNLFDFGLGEMANRSERERRAYLTSVIDLAEFIINGLVGAEQTPMMTGISRYLIQALMVIPDATVATFRDLMAKGGIDGYRPYLEALDDYTRDFFATRFNMPQYEATKAGIFWRLDTMMSDPTFREMFLNPRNKLDLAKELNAGKVIVVNTDRELLKADGAEAFGRFILARLLLATEQRASGADPLPTYVYIDECQDYIANEERIADLVDKARKQKVGFVFAHQRLANIKSTNVADALANTAIQFAGGNKTDAATLAGLLHTEPEFIENRPALSFVAYVKGQTQRGVQVTVPYGIMERMDKMTARQEAAMRQEMRERYGASRRQARAEPQPVAVVAPAKTKWEA